MGVFDLARENKLAYMAGLRLMLKAVLVGRAISFL